MLKKKTALCLALLLCAALTACKDGRSGAGSSDALLKRETTHLYTTLYTDIAYEYDDGGHLLKKTVTNNVGELNQVSEYDAAERLQKDSFYTGGKLNSYDLYEYFSAGEKQIDSDDGTIRYDNGCVKTSYSDNDKTIAHEEYLYDSEGSILKETVYDKRDVTEQNLYTYDSEGRLVEKLEEGKEGSYREQYEYDRSGNMIRKKRIHFIHTSYPKEEDMIMKEEITECKYDNSDKLMEEREITDNEAFTKYSYEYDRDGRMTKMLYYEKSGNIYLEERNEYDSFGNLYKKIEYDEYGNTTMRTEYRY